MSGSDTVANPYQKRLGLLFAGMLAVLVGLALRHAWLSLVHGEENRRAAMSVLTDTTILPTIRGSILDARGEVLAEDRAPGLAVEMRYELVHPEHWVLAEAERKARSTMDRATWRRLSPAARAAATERARPEAAARRLSMLRAIAREARVPLPQLLDALDRIDRDVRRLAEHVHRRQELDWAATALGTDLPVLESLASSPGGGIADARAAGPGPEVEAAIARDPGRRPMVFSAAAVVALGLEPPRPAGTWSLEEVLALRGASMSDFERRPIREQVAFHEILAPVERDAAAAIAVAASQFGLGEVVRLADARIRARPWTDAVVQVEVDGSMLPGPRRFDGIRTVSVRDLGAPLVGRLSPVYAEDVSARPFDAVADRGGYRERDDRVGRTGLEALEESRLRGERGLRRHRIRLSRELDGTGAPEPDLLPRVEGEDVRTTIDIRLQARIHAALHPDIGLTLADPDLHGSSGLGGVDEAAGHPLAVGVAVIDVATGEILALVNGPDREELPDPAFEPIIQEAGWLDLDIAGRWGTTPGSTIKPLILTAAISEGLRSAGDTVTCTGHYFPGRTDVARCWIYRPPGFATHGTLDGAEAIANSCNIFFHRVADSFVGREERLVDWLAHFGFGRRPGNLAIFGPGVRPSVESIDGTRHRFERIMVGTGQAAMVWTPLQAATAFASFFRAGDMPVPQLLVGSAASVAAEASDGTRRREDERDRWAPCVATPEAIWATTEGLERGISRVDGTAFRINVGGFYHRIFTPDAEPSPRAIGSPYESVMIWGKTGTAQERVVLRLPELEEDPPADEVDEADEDGETEDDEGDESSGRIDVRTLSHGWFVGVVAADDLAGVQGEYAIAVVSRWGGSGGYAAGPIANQVILALMQEGYLPMEPGLRPTSVSRGGPVDGSGVGVGPVADARARPAAGDAGG